MRLTTERRVRVSDFLSPGIITSLLKRCLASFFRLGISYLSPKLYICACTCSRVTAQKSLEDQNASWNRLTV